MFYCFTSILFSLTYYAFVQVLYFAGPSVTASDTSNINMTTVIADATNADFVFVCVGEETYTEKPGDINDLSLAQGQIDVCFHLYAFTFK